MADKASDGLPYGQFGRATYDLEDREWKYQRKVTISSTLRHVGDLQVIQGAISNATRSKPDGNSSDGPSRRREKQAKDLVQSVPELQPAIDILPDLARVSETVEDAASQHDSTTGNLIAAGSVFDESRRSYVDAVAFPCGPTGSSLRIVQGLRQRQGWDEQRTSWIETLSFTGEDATWIGPGVPVLSIVFAQPIDSGERYLAVRLETEALVFRPVLRKHAASGRSRLDPNFVFSISIRDTGGHPHADMAFNPWFTGQLAIVDRVGFWTIWETGRKSHQPRTIKSGAIVTKRSKKGEPSLDDGWARIAWVESTTTLCIARRRSFALVDLADGEEGSPITVDVGLRKGYGYILDAGTLKTAPSQICVLTSDHIAVFHISRSPEQRLQSTVLAQIRHHRNPEDLSLQMSLGSNEGSTLLVLRSSLNATVDQYWLEGSDSDYVQFQQPSALASPAGLCAIGLKGCQIQPAPVVSIEQDEHEHLQGFWHIVVYGEDCALTQLLYTTGVSGIFSRRPEWTKSMSKKPAKASAGSARTVNGPILDDISLRHSPTSAYVRRRQRETLLRAGDKWTVSYERLVRAMQTTQIEDSQVDIDEVIEELNNLLRQPKLGLLRPMRSLRELSDGVNIVGGLDGASERLAGIQISDVRHIVKRGEGEQIEESQNQTIRFSSVGPPAALDTVGLRKLDNLAGAVDAMRQFWAAAVEGRLPQAIMAAREERLKSLAIDVVLASSVVRIEDDETQATEDATQTQSQSWELPVRPPPPDAQSPPLARKDYGSQPLQSSALPTPSASASTVTRSSYQSNLAAPEFGRLSKYTMFSKDAPSALSHALNKVLAHWDVGTDPAEYDWRSAACQVSRRGDAEDDDEMTEKERQQMRRRTERYIRRQRKEAEESQRLQMLSRQAPEIMSASQPAHPPGLRQADSQASAAVAMGSSQSYGPSQFAASQVVPGRHGGRPPPKKKRKSGF